MIDVVDGLLIEGLDGRVIDVVDGLLIEGLDGRVSDVVDDLLIDGLDDLLIEELERRTMEADDLLTEGVALELFDRLIETDLREAALVEIASA